MVCANTDKVQAPFLYIRERVGYFGGGGGGVEDVCSVWPIVAPIHLVMSLGVVRLVN